MPPAQSDELWPPIAADGSMFMEVCWQYDPSFLIDESWGIDAGHRAPEWPRSWYFALDHGLRVLHVVPAALLAPGVLGTARVPRGSGRQLIAFGSCARGWVCMQVLADGSHDAHVVCVKRDLGMSDLEDAERDAEPHTAAMVVTASDRAPRTVRATLKDALTGYWIADIKYDDDSDHDNPHAFSDGWDGASSSGGGS